ncbi:hypothetical protein O9929_21320 [Vibrio lentus]|nr:hypothetical protein [Vibrio lentus]
MSKGLLSTRGHSMKSWITLRLTHWVRCSTLSVLAALKQNLDGFMVIKGTIQ